MSYHGERNAAGAGRWWAEAQARSAMQCVRKNKQPCQQRANPEEGSGLCSAPCRCALKPSKTVCLPAYSCALCRVCSQTCVCVALCLELACAWSLVPSLLCGTTVPLLGAGTPLSVRQRAPAAAPRASSRSTVTVQANLFGRLTQVARSYTFFYGDSAGARCGMAYTPHAAQLGSYRCTVDRFKH